MPEEMKKEEVDELKKRLEECEKRAAEYLAGWQRAKADYSNLEKRQGKLLEEFKDFADAATLLELLDIVDSFEEAEKHVPEELKNHEWVKGVMRIKGAWDDFLKRKDVEPIEALGKPFDPHLHESVERVEGEEGKVVEEVQRGYRKGETILRPARVKVGGLPAKIPEEI